MGKVMKIEIEKPVIPQFVADWIESNSSGFNIRGALEGIDSWTTPDILDWCRKVDSELSYKMECQHTIEQKI